MDVLWVCTSSSRLGSVALIGCNANDGCDCIRLSERAKDLRYRLDAFVNWIYQKEDQHLYRRNICTHRSSPRWTHCRIIIYVNEMMFDACVSVLWPHWIAYLNLQ